MKIENHTPLQSVGVGSEWIANLQPLWIESIEELVALYTALGEVRDSIADSGLAVLATSKIIQDNLPSKRLQELQKAWPGGGLGCIVEESTLDEYRRLRRLRPKRPTPVGTFEKELPKSVRLMDRMMSIRDQGARGTCVAFGTVALREFLLNSQIDLSEQFLYWACKELDGYPGPGTYIHTAMTALAQYGVCHEEKWPYHPAQLEDEGQGPPPQEALENARDFIMSSTRTVEPNLVVHYKSVLAGDGGQPGMPITFGTLVFNSWYRSPETHRTGKITMPLPKEEPVGGHAWCVVGYVDDSNVPGGGYFIVRNSWGSRWASASPEAAGHALMPYAYVENYAFEAFTGPVSIRGEEKEDSDPIPPEYRRIIIDSTTRDRDGKLWLRGTKVLLNPSELDVLREDTPTNRAKFIQQDYTWTIEARQKVWFPPSPKQSEELRGGTERSLRAGDAFFAAISDNLTQAKGDPVPEVKSLPFWYAALAWEPKIKEAREVADLSNEIARAIAESSGLPAGIFWPQDWADWLSGLNRLKVWALSGMATTIHVVAAVPTCVRFERKGRIVIVPPGQEEIDRILEVYKDWSSKSGHQATFAFITVATALRWPEDMTGHTAGDHWLVISNFRGGSDFETIAPPRITDRASLRDFIDRLHPETEQHRIAKVKGIVDEYLETGYEGYITLEKIKKETGYRRSFTKRAFAALSKLNHYKVYKTPDGDIAIAGKTGKLGKSIDAAQLLRHRFHHAVFLGPAFIGVGIWFLKDVFLGRPFDVRGFAIMLPLGYLGEWLKIRLEKYRENKE